MADRSRGAASSSVDDAADELYGLPLDRFTAARNEKAAEVRESGDADGARRIGKLAKPNTVGWLANQLVRQHRDEIDPLLELGGSLREATAALDADQMRSLSTQRHQIVHALTQQARALASAAGQPVSDATARGLEETLHAALADEAAAEQLVRGRLTAGLSRSGFPGLEADGAGDAGSSTSRSSRSQSTTARAQRTSSKASGRNGASDPADRRRQELERAEQDESDARQAADAAATARDQAQEALDQAEDAVRSAADEVDRIRAELDEAVAGQTAADRTRRKARKELERSDRVARQAERRRADATARRQTLSGERRR